MILRKRIYLTLIAAAALGLATILSACEQAALDANTKEVQQQQAQIEQNQMEIQKLMAQQQSYGGGAAPGSAPASAGNGCDKSVMATATRHGGDKMAASDFSHALGYYQDALTACPNDARAELNLARAYEAAGNRSSAIEHFRAAAHNTDPAQASAEAQARNALVRLRAN
jgi:tetratricopeptide (TPR) repeat protein